MLMSIDMDCDASQLCIVLKNCYIVGTVPNSSWNIVQRDNWRVSSSDVILFIVCLFKRKAKINIFLVCCDVLLCVFTFWVSCCDVRYDFCIITMFGSSLPAAVCRRAHVLFTLLQFVCVLVVSNTHCVVFMCCFSSSCVSYVAGFSGLSFSDYPFGIL